MNTQVSPFKVGVLPSYGVRGRIETAFGQANTVRRRAAVRVLHRSRTGSSVKPGRSSVPPERPIGAKLEVTHRCNLLCSFCYTDSPAKTKTRPHELTNDEWMTVVDDVIASGVVEAVVTGGEPLLRKDLTLQVIERLTSAGIAVVLNTNGWFVDDRTADVFARCSGLIVSVSLDGFAPEVHDAERGVDGSWAKAVIGIDRLLSRGVTVRIAHVVTPANQNHLRTFLDGLSDFGVSRLRIVVVNPTSGNATRVGSKDEWAVDVAAVRACVDDFKRRRGSGIQIALIVPGPDGGTLHETPDVYLVRPNGDLVFDSLRPVRFGTVHQGIVGSWANLRDVWPTVASTELAQRLEHQIAYRDDDVDLVIAAPSGGTPVSITRGPREREANTVAHTNGQTVPAPETAIALPSGGGDVVSARKYLQSLVADRHFVTAPMRWAGDTDGKRVVRLATGSKHIVSASAGEILDVFVEPRRAGDAIKQVIQENGLADDAFNRVWTGVLSMVHRGLIVPFTDTQVPTAFAQDPLTDIQDSA